MYDHVCEFINDNWIHGNLKNYCGDWSFLVFMLSTESTVQEMTPEKTHDSCFRERKDFLLLGYVLHLRNMAPFPIELLPKPTKQHSNSSSGRRSRRDTEVRKRSQKNKTTRPKQTYLNIIWIYEQWDDYRVHVMWKKALRQISEPIS